MVLCALNAFASSLSVSVRCFHETTVEKIERKAEKKHRIFPYKRSRFTKRSTAAQQNKSAIADILLCVRFTQFNHTRCREYHHRRRRRRYWDGTTSTLNESLKTIFLPIKFSVLFIYFMRRISRNEMLCSNATRYVL